MSAYALIAFDILDPEGYAAYQQATAPTVADYDIRVLARTDQFNVIEGTAPAQSIGILEFNDMDTLKRWYFSEAYQASLPLLADSVNCKFLVFLDGINNSNSSESSVYFLASFDVLNPDGYAEYQNATVHLIDRFDINVLTMTETFEVVEGNAPSRRIGILEFRDRETLKQWYDSADYQATASVRSSSLDTHFIIALDGPTLQR